VEPLSTEAVLALERAMPAAWRAMVTLMAGAGLRPGEAAAVTVDRVDFRRRSLLVDRQLLMRPARLRPPKTAASVRTVPLPQVVVDALAARMAEHPPGIDGMLFTSGPRILNRYHLGKAFRRAALEVGAEGATPHVLGHYYASLLIRHGESVKVGQMRLGHASARETLDTYCHVWPDSEDLTRSAVDSVLGAAADSLRTDGHGSSPSPQVSATFPSQRCPWS
jgi:integrase